MERELTSENDEIDTLAESIAEHVVMWGEDEEGNDVPMGFDVAELRSLLVGRLAQAWDAGVVAAHRSDLTLFAIKQVNPYRVTPPATTDGGA